MIFRAISSLMAMRASLTFTMTFPPRAATTVTVPPATKPRSVQMLFHLGAAAHPVDEIFFAHVG